nr:sodium-coupled monocarboxylate transporter 1 isoform X1 [Paramormyrops kingsleyae]
MDASTKMTTFVVWDYVVFALMLLVSAAVGVYFALAGKGQRNSQDFLMGGRGLTALPVAFSLTASFMSAITVLATPAEVYQYGAIYGFFGIAYMLVVAVCSEVFLPVFYRLGITSSYEYLELRFNRAARLCGTMMFILQTVSYTGMVIYAPALALNQVTGFDLWGAVIATGIVCTFYCTLGGLKAVVWTDVFQVGIMVAGFLSVIIRATWQQGGFLAIIDDSRHGGRLNFWNFDPSPLRRHTFWTITFGGAFVWISIYGVNQAQVQRYISCKSLIHAKMALLLNLLGLWVVLLCSVFSGLCLYSIYKNCDPWNAGLVSAPDQLMPYMVLDILRDFPGVPGLFVAAAYSGTLSTVSSSINALAAVTVEDLVKPHFSMSERTLSWMSKGLSVVFGVICIGMAGIASVMGGILQAAISIMGISGGPVLGLFSLGILCPFANSVGALVGFLSGIALSLWVGIGAHLYTPSVNYKQPLHLSTDGCNLTMTNGRLNWTLSREELPIVSTVLQEDPEYRTNVNEWYSLSYLYFSVVGTITVMAVGIIVSLLTGSKKLTPEMTLKKEDLTCYYLYSTLKQKISQAMKRTSNLDLNKRGEKDFGRNNPAFCSSELDLSQVRVRRGSFSP